MNEVEKYLALEKIKKEIKRKNSTPLILIIVAVFFSLIALILYYTGYSLKTMLIILIPAIIVVLYIVFGFIMRALLIKAYEKDGFELKRAYVSDIKYTTIVTTVCKVGFVDAETGKPLFTIEKMEYNKNLKVGNEVYWTKLNSKLFKNRTAILFDGSEEVIIV